MPYSNPPVIAVFLTPSLARLAYEQIAVWNEKENKGTAGEVPGQVETSSRRLRHVLECVGVSFGLLESAGVAKVENRREHGCGMTSYTDTYQHVTIDMSALYKLSIQLPPVPGAVAPRRAARADGLTRRFGGKGGG